MTLTGFIDDQSLLRYRLLLDAEDAAFDELEHAYEDGDRALFEADLRAWEQAITAKMAYLRRLGMEIPAIR